MNNFKNQKQKSPKNQQKLYTNNLQKHVKRKRKGLPENLRRKQHKHIDSIEHKHCAGCDQWKTFEKYSKSKTNWDCLDRTCKECRKKYQKKWRNTPEALQAQKIRSQKWSQHKQQIRKIEKKVKMMKDLEEYEYKPLPFDSDYVCTKSGMIYSMLQLKKF